MRCCRVATRLVRSRGRCTSLSFTPTSRGHVATSRSHVGLPELSVWQMASQESTPSSGLRRPTAQPLLDLFDVSAAGRSMVRLKLHAELCVRLTWAIQQLQDLPAGLSQTPEVTQVVSSYMRSLKALDSCASASGWVSDDASVVGALQECFSARTNPVPLVTRAVRELQSRVGIDSYDRNFRETVDARLECFFTGHVGIRFLTQQSLLMAERASRQAVPKSAHQRTPSSHRTYSTLSVPSSWCDPADIADSVAQKTQDLCRKMLGRAPEVVVEDVCQVELQHWPAALHYVLAEVLKNACKAVVDRCPPAGSEDALAPVICRIDADDRWLRITVTDQGTGIPAESLDRIWGYVCSGASKKEGSACESVAGNTLSGFGIGLPLSRLYLRYFGGDLRVSSVEGEGTMVQLVIDRRSSHDEVLDNAWAMPRPLAESHVSLSLE